MGPLRHSRHGGSPGRVGAARPTQRRLRRLVPVQVGRKSTAGTGASGHSAAGIGRNTLGVEREIDHEDMRLLSVLTARCRCALMSASLAVKAWASSGHDIPR